MVRLEPWHLSAKIAPILVAIFLSLAAFVVFLPTLGLPFSLIDDGESIRVTREISRLFSLGDWSDLSNILIEKDFGRVRAGYWLFQWTYVHLFGLSAFTQHFARIIIALIILLCVYLMGLIASGSLLVALISGIFFVFFFPSMENFVRLGPAEIPQLLIMAPLILSVIYQAFSSKKFSAPSLFIHFFAMTVVYAVKENSIILFPLFFLVYFFNRTKPLKNQLLALSLYSLALTLSMIAASLIVRNTSGNYSSFYRFDLETIVYSLEKYAYIFRQSLGFVLLLAPLSFLRLLYKSLSRRLNTQDHYQLIFWVWFLAGFMVQLPWSFPLGRYLITFLPGLALALAIELKVIISVFKSPVLKYAVLTTLIVFFLTKNIIGYFNYLNDYQSREITNAKMISFFVTSSPLNSLVVLNLSREANAIEWFVEAKLHFDYLYGRPDLSLVRPDEVGNLKPSYLAVWSEYPLLKDEILTGYLSDQQTIHLKTYQSTSLSVSASPFRFVKHLALGGLDEAMSTIIQKPKTYRWDIYKL